MKKNKNNEELQSRRDFFKRAAKGALPVLGVVAMMTSPIILKAAEVPMMKTPMGCNRQDCTNACIQSCSSCTGTCRGDCTGRCSGACRSSCTNTCKEDCRSNCSWTCIGSCRNSCLNTCKTGCQGSEYSNY